MANDIDEDFENANLEGKLGLLGFESGNPSDLFLESSLGTARVKRLHEVLNALAGASNLLDAVDEETQGSECDSCKRVQSTLNEE